MDENYICSMKDERPTITVKLKPYLQEYIRSELRRAHASKRNILGIILMPLLEKLPAGMPPFMPKGADFITFTLPFTRDIDIRGDVWISPANQEMLEKYLEWHFKQLFFNYMNDKVRYCGSFKKAILQFCADYEFAMNHINYEMLKKDYYRKRKKKKEEKSFPLSVPGLSPGFYGIYVSLN
jgi:hypothetical protein